MGHKCLNCGKDLSGKREGAKFCGLPCKNKYNYKNDEHIEGVQYNSKNIPSPEIEDNSLENSLNGVITKKDLNEDQGHSNSYSIDSEIVDNYNFSYDSYKTKAKNTNETDKGNDSEEIYNNESEEENEELPLPPMYIEKQTKVLSLDYKIKSSVLEKKQAYLQTISKEYKELEDKLNYETSRNGNIWVWAGGITGGTYGFLNQTEPPKIKKRPIKDEEIPSYLIRKYGKYKAREIYGKTKYERSAGPGFGERLFHMLFGLVVGASAGVIVQKLTENWREQDKKQEIEKIAKRLDFLKQEYKNASADVGLTTKQLSGLPQYITKTEQVLNPEYQDALAGILLKQNGINDIAENWDNNSDGHEKVNDWENINTDEPIKPKEQINPGEKQENKKQAFKFNSDKIVSAKDVGRREYKALDFKGVWREFFGLPSLNFHCLIHGNSGEGKSTFCMWFARYLAKNFGRVLYVSGEEGLNKTFQDKLKFCKAEVDNFYILDVRTGQEFLNEVKTNEFHFIILDSLHDMDIDAKFVKEIMERYKNTAFITINQNNKKGEMFGANEFKHIHDIVVNVANYTAETTKNRFKQKGMVCKTADFNSSEKQQSGLHLIKGGQNSGKENRKDENNNNKGYDLDQDRRNIL